MKKADTHQPRGGSTSPTDLAALLSSAVAWHQKDERARAEALYLQVLSADPQNFDALHLLGAVYFQNGDFAAAERLFSSALLVNPEHAIALFNLGTTLQELGRNEEALECFERALCQRPDYADASNNRGMALLALGRVEDAVASFDEAIALAPSLDKAWLNRGNALLRLRSYGEALASYEKALVLRPNEVLNRLGHATGLLMLGRWESALVELDSMLEDEPELLSAHWKSVLALMELRRYEEGLSRVSRALELRPDSLEGLKLKGDLLVRVGRAQEALPFFERAIGLDPKFADARLDRATALVSLRRFTEAREALLQIEHEGSRCDFLQGSLLSVSTQICEWSGLSENVAGLESGVLAGDRVATPFSFLGLSDRSDLHLRAAEVWISSRHPSNPALGSPPVRKADGKIRLGYYSADFHAHATAFLMAELFEAHDRSRFEVFAFSFGPDHKDAMRKRLTTAVDRFIDVTAMSDEDVARRSRELGIDIAVDLKGFTRDSRTGIFAHRCAPTQVNYLGYPGTMGAEFIDYILADRIVIPEEARPFYREKVVYLPHCYQVNDSKRKIADRQFSRSELGLPEKGFVFCCFNNNYKILPATFDGWMRILEAVHGSVLWLFEDNPAASTNLRKEAEARGIDPSRLVFASRMRPGLHLARHRVADLFLDTFPYNAHTTASDALWAGLPLLTLMGKSFAARVAASLLHALDLPELIAASQADYELKAIQLARDPAALAVLRSRLEANRRTSPLFDGARFARDLEQIFEDMHHNRDSAAATRGSGHVLTESGRIDSVKSNSIQRALALHARGDIDGAERCLAGLPESVRDRPDVLHLLAHIAGHRGMRGEALDLAQRAVRADESNAEYRATLGKLQFESGDSAKALENYEVAVRLRPDFSDAFVGRGKVLRSLRRPGDALASFGEAIRLQPKLAAAYIQRGRMLQHLRRSSEALADFDTALRLDPNLAEAHLERGNVLQTLKRGADALASYDAAISLMPGNVGAHVERALTLRGLKRYIEAAESYELAKGLAPDYPFIDGLLSYMKRRICSWDKFSAETRAIRLGISAGARVTTAWSFLSLVDDPGLQLKVSRTWTRQKAPRSRLGEPTASHAADGKIRVGYYSADFYAHATAFLMAELFEAHDRSRFEVFAFSFGPDRKDAMRKRLAAAVDRFIDVTTMGDEDVARHSRELGIDIAIDLKGFTTDSRLGIFAHRCAPIQVNYLGYPGTMGADFIDYIIADRTVIPEEAKAFYSEKVVYLPHCYQVNDSKRKIADRQFTRAELGLPETGFVFCCFNNNYKILPATFDGWMRILEAVDGSVLWLFEDNPAASTNLRKEAEARGVDPSRLVFAAHMPLNLHLARHRLADLFLDTVPCNAHTTASDALWAGLPLLTLMGKSFAARVAASLLHALDLPELITTSQADYELKAIQLARDPAALARLRSRLAANRVTSPLFDGTRFARDLESALISMHTNHRPGKVTT